jgi:hypothetical protein
MIKAQVKPCGPVGLAHMGLHHLGPAVRKLRIRMHHQQPVAPRFLATAPQLSATRGGSFHYMRAPGLRHNAGQIC